MPRNPISLPVQTILIIKTGALGDVLRTTSILAGLRATHPSARIEWVTARDAGSLVEAQADVDRTHLVDPASPAELEALAGALDGLSWDWVISLDDERELCALATRLGQRRLSGAYLDRESKRVYSSDVAPWFDMGLLSVHGRQAADRLKLENQRSHPEIHAEMLGIPVGRPELPLSPQSIGTAGALFEGVGRHRPLIGLNTGAGGRWTSKQLSISSTVELAIALGGAFDENVGLVVLGGIEEAERNAAILAGLRAEDLPLTVVDAGVNNSLLEFAAIIDRLDLLISSDSLALHVGVARRVPVVAFFAATSAAEIELYGLGEKVSSEAPDYCSYKPDADNTTITTERLLDAAKRVITDTLSD